MNFVPSLHYNIEINIIQLTFISYNILKKYYISYKIIFKFGIWGLLKYCSLSLYVYNEEFLNMAGIVVITLFVKENHV